MVVRLKDSSCPNLCHFPSSEDALSTIAYFEVNELVSAYVCLLGTIQSIVHVLIIALLHTVPSFDPSTEFASSFSRYK